MQGSMKALSLTRGTSREIFDPDPAASAGTNASGGVV